ncbi:MAG TPA: hypothetical protein V6D08_07545 [Candidatus Obscuribacterales bacterium]
MSGRRNLIALVGFLAGGLFIISANPAEAQGYAQSQGVKVRKDALEKVTWYKHPIEIQILDTTPTIKDFRTPASAPGSIDIPLGPVGNAGANAASATIPPGGLKLGGGPAGFRLESPGLPKVGFGSNINPSKLKPAQGLPSGSSTNLLAGKFAKPAQATAPAPKMASPRPIIASQPTTKVATYQNLPVASVSGGSSLKVTTGVKAVLKRGDLLK